MPHPQCVKICPADMEIFLLSPVAMHVSPLPYTRRSFILHGHIVLFHPASCQQATQRLRLYDTPTGSDKNVICQVQYRPWSIWMFKRFRCRSADKVWGGKVSCFDCREMTYISARNCTGLMDKSLCEDTNMRWEPFDVTFFNYENEMWTFGGNIF
jgi:hypothetical protein